MKPFWLSFGKTLQQRAYRQQFKRSGQRPAVSGQKSISPLLEGWPRSGWGVSADGRYRELGSMQKADSRQLTAEKKQLYRIVSSSHLVLSILFSFLTFLLLLSSPPARAQESQCMISPNVQSELEALDTAIQQHASNIKNECPRGPQGNLRGYKEAYLEFLSIGLDAETWRSSLRKLVDADENQALSHDLEIYYNKIKMLNDVAKTAASSCSSEMVEIKATKEKFYNGYIKENGQIAGLRALRNAREATYNNALNYFYQDGYYGNDSPYACSSSEYGFKDLKNIFERFKQNLKNIKKRGDEIKAREGSVLLAEFQAELSSSLGVPLITVQEANDRLARSCGRETGNSFTTLFENIGTCIKNSVKIAKEQFAKDENQTIRQRSQNQSSVTAEQVQHDVAASKENYNLQQKIETKRNIYASFYNKDVSLRNVQIEDLLVNSDQFISKSLCPNMKKTAEDMLRFCNNTVQNKPSICSSLKTKLDASPCE